MMDKNLYIRNEKLAQIVIKGLESRNMTGYYAANIFQLSSILFLSVWGYLN